MTFAIRLVRWCIYTIHIAIGCDVCHSCSQMMYLHNPYCYRLWLLPFCHQIMQSHHQCTFDINIIKKLKKQKTTAIHFSHSNAIFLSGLENSCLGKLPSFWNSWETVYEVWIHEYTRMYYGSHLSLVYFYLSCFCFTWYFINSKWHTC